MRKQRKVLTGPVGILPQGYPAGPDGFLPHLVESPAALPAVCFLLRNPLYLLCLCIRGGNGNDGGTPSCL